MTSQHGASIKPEVFDRYPAWMALVGYGLSASIYLAGAYVVSGLGRPAWIAYLGYCAFVEIAVLRRSCMHCHYYGKVCGLGRGWVCAVLFRRGNPEQFVQRLVSVREVVPDLLVAAIPLVAGVVLLLRRFNWPVLFGTASILLLASAGNALVRGSLACRHCAQREIGCPAERLFNGQGR